MCRQPKGRDLSRSAPLGKRTITQTADAGGLSVINHDPTTNASV